MQVIQRFSFLIFIVVVLVSCQSFSQPSPDSWQSRPIVGSKLVLHQDLEVPLGLSRVHLQLGEVRARKDVNELKPYCYFYLRRPREELDNPITIIADEFIIQNVYRRRVAFRIEQQQFALVVTGIFDSGSSQHTMATFSELYSPKQAQVTRLVCAVWDDPMEYNHVSLTEIVKALGDIATINPDKYLPGAGYDP